MNEIVTFGMNYQLNAGIEVFVNSSIKHADAVTVLGINLDASVVSFLEKSGINYLDVSDICTKHQIPLTLSPYTLKVILFYIYAKKYSEATNLYMCDFTDVLIQRSPFSLILEDKCYVSSENQIVRNCETNTTWINHCYNRDILGLLANKEILNGGSILGSREKCLYLLHEMVIDCQGIIDRIGNYQNIDQASMIKCVYFDQKNYVILNDGSIFNMAYGCEFFQNYQYLYKLDMYPTPVVELSNGTIPCVVHQYDIDKKLEERLQHDYR